MAGVPRLPGVQQRLSQVYRRLRKDNLQMKKKRRENKQQLVVTHNNKNQPVCYATVLSSLRNCRVAYAGLLLVPVCFLPLILDGATQTRHGLFRVVGNRRGGGNEIPGPRSRDGRPRYATNGLG